MLFFLTLPSFVFLLHTSHNLLWRAFLYYVLWLPIMKSGLFKPVCPNPILDITVLYISILPLSFGHCRTTILSSPPIAFAIFPALLISVLLMLILKSILLFVTSFATLSAISFPLMLWHHLTCADTHKNTTCKFCIVSAVFQSKCLVCCLNNCAVNS